MIPSYSLIIPYYKTPEITRLALRSVQRFCKGAHETVVIDNAPGSPESTLLNEFPEIKKIDNATAFKGSLANFEAVDIGIQAATHDLIGILHSDTIFLQPGWDCEVFQRMEEKNLAALGTFEREASPHRPAHRKIRDAFMHCTHCARPPKGHQGKLMLFFLLTRKSALKSLDFSFVKSGHLLPHHLENIRNGVETLSCIEISRLLWHTNNVTSLLTGQMTDAKMKKNFEKKRELLLQHPSIREIL
ncbi:MAG: glycosyltransferase family 2 protein [Verrucomicrobiota bacterium]